MRHKETHPYLWEFLVKILTKYKEVGIKGTNSMNITTSTFMIKKKLRSEIRNNPAKHLIIRYIVFLIWKRPDQIYFGGFVQK